jgi:preprotein translocase subunit YajC
MDMSSFNWTPFVIFAGFIGFMYWFIIRPQREQQRKAKEMLDALAVGDEVITIGGLHGTVAEMDEDVVTLRIASDTEVVFDKATIGKVLGGEDEEN